MKMKPKKMPKAKKGSDMPFMPDDKKAEMKYKKGRKAKKGAL